MVYDITPLETARISFNVESEFLLFEIFNSDTIEHDGFIHNMLLPMARAYNKYADAYNEGKTETEYLKEILHICDEWQCEFCKGCMDTECTFSNHSICNVCTPDYDIGRFLLKEAFIGFDFFKKKIVEENPAHYEILVFVTLAESFGVL